MCTIQVFLYKVERVSAKKSALFVFVDKPKKVHKNLLNLIQREEKLVKFLPNDLNYLVGDGW